MSSESLLEIGDINTYYGDSHILTDLSFDVEQGTVVSLLGRNGVGKTTTLRSIMGLTPPRSGTIRFDGEEITELSPHDVLERGIAHVPEERVIFPNLTVKENLRVPKARGGSGGTRFDFGDIYDLFPRLSERESQLGNTLSGGEQQMLAIARGLLTNPELLMLDEPSEGLAPQIVADVQDVILRLAEEGITILLVEQNFQMAKACADRHYILDKGEIRYEGQLDSLSEDRRQKLLGVA
jgi:branched-chain amino acid transport system ATP-binding protein